MTFLTLSVVVGCVCRRWCCTVDTRKVPAGAPASETNDENVVNTMSSNSKNQQRRPRQSQSQVSAATSRLGECRDRMI